jgi:hypothetical protein
MRSKDQKVNIKSSLFSVKLDALSNLGSEYTKIGINAKVEQGYKANAVLSILIFNK